MDILTNVVLNLKADIPCKKRLPTLTEEMAGRPKLSPVKEMSIRCASDTSICNSVAIERQGQ